LLVLDDDAVYALYPLHEAIDVMAEALRALSAGRVQQPLRVVVRAGRDEAFAVMPACVTASGRGAAAFGAKAIALRAQGPARGLDTVLGVVVIFDPDTGLPLAVLDATSVTAIRTAAASALATKVLARPDAGVLAILGTGAQARSHLRAMALARPLRHVRVWGRSPDGARAFARWACEQVSAPVVEAPDVAAAVAGADLICTTTASGEPILDVAAVSAGAHINAVGAAFHDRRELASDLVTRAAVFVDSREAALAEAGDLIAAIRQGAFQPEGIRAELGEVLLGRRPGRADGAEVTVFKSVGLAVEDVMSGLAVVRRARERGAGVEVRLNRHEKLSPTAAGVK
jgi:alanine dehydrogenase